MKLLDVYIERVKHFALRLLSFIVYYLQSFRAFCANLLRVHSSVVLKLFLPILIICAGYYACTRSKSIIEKNVVEIFQISDDIRSYYANKPDYWGVSTQSVIDNKIVSEEFINGGKLILHGHTEIRIGNGENADAVMPLSQYFDIIMSNLNKAQCMAYAEAPLLQEDRLKLNSIRIINILGDYLFEWGGKRKLPIAKYMTRDLCIDGSNTIIWSLR